MDKYIKYALLALLAYFVYMRLVKPKTAAEVSENAGASAAGYAPGALANWSKTQPPQTDMSIDWLSVPGGLS